ncbi:ABC transporter substrate-binding protein [Synergistales bacterium]|nr:ABC transporter substrate-binding protein [Synergistales bacterium]
MKKRMFLGFMAVLAVLLGVAGGALSADFTMKVGYVVPESYPHHIAAATVLKPYIEKESGGRIEVELYPNGQLGQDRQLCESIQLGAIEMAFPSTTTFAGFIPQLQLMDLPYLFTSKEQVRSALDGEVGKLFAELARKQGMYILGFGDIGFLHISNSVKPIVKLEDASGLKIRVMENPVSIATAKALGMNPSTMTFGEVYTALQQNVVDGQEHCINVTRNMKFNEVQKFYSLTGEAFSSISVIVSEAFLDSLPADLKAVVIEAVKRFSVEQRKVCDTQEITNLQALKDSGMQVNELSKEELARFVAATKEVRDSNAAKIDPDLYQKIQTFLK